MRLKQLAAVLALLACALDLRAQELSNYPTATTPLTGAERLIGDQAGNTVNVTPAQLAQYAVPAANQIPPQAGQGGNCVGTNGSSLLFMACSGGGTGGSAQFSTITTNTALSTSLNSVLVNAATNNVVVTLPTAVGANNVYYVKRIDGSGNVVAVVPSSAQTIDGQPSVPIQAKNLALSFKSDNSNWWVASAYTTSITQLQYVVLPNGQAINLPNGQGILIP